MSRGSLVVVSAGPKATYPDLLKLGEGVRAEIVDGVIVERAGPSGEHSMAQLGIGGVLRRRFGRAPGGRWPGGWWIGTELDVEYEPHQVFCHDVAGWKRERLVEGIKGRPQRTRPDWVCEILSPSTRRRDQLEKLRVIQRAGVPHYWLVDPEERTLIVHRLDGDSYRLVLTATGDEVVRAEPFEAVELRMPVLFDGDDEE